MRILAPMVADLFHSGHVTFLKKIRDQYPNDTIIVGLIPDDYVNTYKRIPVITYDKRNTVLSSCKYVDVIKMYKMESNFLEINNIDFLVHANNEDETEKYLKIFNINKENFIRFDYSEGISTTDIINRILNCY